MKLYLVRHGESTANAMDISQDHTTKLSERGHSQAHTVANRFTDVPIDVILSSPYIRAKQTAEIIQGKVHKDIVYTDLLGEIKRPSEAIGKPHTHPELKRIRDEISLHKDDPDWHYSDEENFSELKIRAIECLKFIEQRPEEKILAVTHGLFTRIIIAEIVFGKLFSQAMYECLSKNMKSENTGVTICEKTDSGPWKVLAWNDYAHLP